MRFFFKIVKILILFLLLAFVGAGFYAGNTAYETMLTAPWEKILGVTKQTAVAAFTAGSRRTGGSPWKSVPLTGRNCAEPTSKTAALLTVRLFFFTGFIRIAPCASLMWICIGIWGIMSSSSTSGATEKAAAAIPPGVFVKQTILMPGQSG